MRSGRFDRREIYSSEWSPAPGIDPAGNSGGGHPIVAWIGRDDGDVHVVVAQPRARLSAGIGSVFVFGTHFVANQPVPKGNLGNRRPSVANVVVPGEGAFVLVAWEAPHPHETSAYSYQDIKARLFDRFGLALSDEFTLHDARLAGRAAPHVFPLDPSDGGGFYAFWMDTSEPPPGTGLGSWCIKGRRWTFDRIGGASATNTP